ncbi:MAG: hypothetical protein EOM34_14315 [Clostridia bacterium]|nr:phospholipase D family protein [Lachnospiraceae bacterium]NCC01820.1 hypothetical protein [Clostridia bacterium]NCD03772.1 hypothetical protein [Clostridia bacterium]
MLNPNGDRLDYGKILAPPVSYQLDFAVGTTYSLDLDALVGICIALGLAADTDSDIMKNPICLLEALRSTGDKVALFCEGGQIHLPGNVTPLYILLEKMVFQVATKAKKGITNYPSFHPKFWLLRYINEQKEVLYRVVVLSRNLTFDRSWDVSFFMDGELGEETDKNLPVADFLKYLAKQLPKSELGNEKTKSIRQLMKELAYVNFDTGMKEFYDFDFIPNGVPCSRGGFYSVLDTPLMKGKNDQDEKSFHELLVMSPFLSKDVIRQFNERSKWIEHTEYVLITRAMSLSRLKPEDCDKFKIYVLKDAVVDGEMAISEAESDYQKQDIHAKIYMMRKYADTDLYLGSLNASHNAVYGNIEFMLRLKSKNRYLNLEKLKEGIFDGPDDGANNPFTQVTLNMEQKEMEEEAAGYLDVIVKQINRCNLHAIVAQNGDYYNATVNAADYEDSETYTVTLRPLLSVKTVDFATEMVFEKLAISALSEFYVLSVSDKDNNTVQRVIKIETEGMPENREQKVISSLIGDNEQNFYRYIAFLLGDDYVISALEAENQYGKNGFGETHAASEHLPVLYEKMLQTAATAPERFTEIEKLVQAVSEDGVVPDGFERLYSTFRKVVK